MSCPTLASCRGAACCALAATIWGNGRRFKALFIIPKYNWQPDGADNRIRGMRGGGRAGAAAVEAVALGFVLVLLLAMLQQYGWGMAQKLVLEEAARHGAQAARRLAFSGQTRPSFQALQAEAFRAMADFLRANGLKDASPLSSSGALRAGLVAARHPGDAIARVHLTSKNLFLKLTSGGEITAEVMTYVGTGASGFSPLSTCTQTASDCLGHVFTAQAADCPQAEEQARQLAQQHELLHGCGDPGPRTFQCRQKASDRCGHEFEAVASSSVSLEEACRIARIQAEQLAQQHQAQDPPGCGQPPPPPPVDCYKCEGGNLIKRQFIGSCPQNEGWSPSPLPCPPRECSRFAGRVEAVLWDCLYQAWNNPRGCGELTTISVTGQVTAQGKTCQEAESSYRALAQVWCQAQAVGNRRLAECIPLGGECQSCQ